MNILPLFVPGGLDGADSRAITKTGEVWHPKYSRREWLTMGLTIFPWMLASAGSRWGARDNYAQLAGSAPAGCNTADQTNGGTDGGSSQYLGYQAAWTYIAQQFTADATATLCKVDVPLKNTGSVNTPTITASIYTNVSTAPGALVGSSSDPVSLASITSSFTTITFSNMSAAVTSGTSYWLVLKISAISTSSVVLWSEWTTVGFFNWAHGTAVPAWTVVNHQASLKFLTYHS